MAEAQRYALVIGSQCAGLTEERRLSFLPELAEDLYGVLTDPDLGACASALPDSPSGGLVLDPTRDTLLTSLETAFETASQPGPDRAGSTLVLAMMGHGMAKENDFYFLPKDGSARGRTSSDVLLSQHLKELLRDYASLKGVIVWLDTCQAGVAATQAAYDWTGMVLRQANRRFEVFVASDDRPAYRGDFTKLLLEKIKEGVKKDVPHLGSHELKPLIKLQDQRPQLITADSQTGTTGLWLSYNKLGDNRRRRIRADEAAGQRAIDHAARLVEFLQPTPTLDVLVQKTRDERVVKLTGYMGEGKSTLAAALAQANETDGHVDAGFVHAIAFGRQEAYGSTLASTLAGQLRKNIPAFADAADEFARNHAGEGDQTDALERKVFGPIRLLDPRQTVRLVIDAFDELPDETQQAVREVITSVTRRADGVKPQPDIRFVLTSRPAQEASGVRDQWELKIGAADATALGGYFRDRGVDETHISRLIEYARGNWLHAWLWANQAVPGSGARGLSRQGAVSLAELYEAELEGAIARTGASWERQLRPVLAVCAAVATNPRLPRAIAAAAAERLGGPSRDSRMQFEDALNALSSLVVRPDHGGTLGISHASLVEEYFDKPELSAKFAIDMGEVHAAISDALRELVPADNENAPAELHRYALEFESDHLWESKRYSEIVGSLAARRLTRAVDERERWQRWTNKLNQKLNHDDEAMVTARENLAAWIGNAGDPRGALENLHRLLPVRRTLSGDDHEKTILARGRIAYYTAKTGELTAASEQYGALLDFCRSTFPPNHKTTLQTWKDFARFTGEAGHPVKACNELKKLHELCVRNLGDDDENTIAVSENLARFTGEAGDPAGARSQYEQVLPRRTNQSGVCTNTLITMSNLAYFTGEAGDPYEARRRFKSVLPLWAEEGEKHPDLLTIRANLARFTAEAGDVEDALNELNEVFALRQEISGDGHPDTLTTSEILARLTAQLGDPGTAARILRNLLPDREFISGETHPDTLATRTNLACFEGMDVEPEGTYYDVLEAADELTEVSAMTERQDRRQRMPGWSSQLAELPIGKKQGSSSEHPDTLTIRAPLAQMNALLRSETLADPPREQPELLETCRKLQHLVEARVVASGEEHPDTLTTMENLAYFVGVAGDVTSAVLELSRLARLRNSMFTENHPTTMTTLGNLAYFRLAAGDGERARRLLETVLRMRESASGKKHPETVYIRSRLGSITGPPDSRLNGTLDDHALRL